MYVLKSFVVAAALVVGAAAPAVLAQPMHGGPGMHRGYAAFDGQRLIQMLDDVGASEAQVKQVQDIFKTAREELKAQGMQGQQMHLQMLQLWAAPSIDAAAMDALRKQGLAQHERASARMQAAFVEAGRVLSPEQRAKLLELAKKRMERMHRRMGHGG